MGFIDRWLERFKQPPRYNNLPQELRRAVTQIAAYDPHTEPVFKKTRMAPCSSDLLCNCCSVDHIGVEKLGDLKYSRKRPSVSAFVLRR